MIFLMLPSFSRRYEKSVNYQTPLFDRHLTTIRFGLISSEKIVKNLRACFVGLFQVYFFLLDFESTHSCFRFFSKKVMYEKLVDLRQKDIHPKLIRPNIITHDLTKEWH